LEANCADYGQALGTAFQIIDDVLDYAGDAAVMGKSLGDDLREGKATLPLIAAMQQGTAAERQLIRGAIESGLSEDEARNAQMLQDVIAIVHRTGALDIARTAASQEAERAIAAAQSLPANSHSASLVQLATQLLARQ